MPVNELETLLSNKIGKKSTKKLFKKLKLKKLGPILEVLMALVVFVTKMLDDKKPAKPQTPTGYSQQKEGVRSQSSNKGSVSDSRLQDYVNRALAYQQEIDYLVKTSPKETDQARLRDLAQYVHQWVQAIKTLVQRVDSYHQNRLIQQDLKSVPKSVANLEERLAQETNPTIRAEIERTLTHRQSQQAMLENLQQTMTWAELKIESTLSLLGTIYSQILAGQSKNHVADYRRLLSEADEEVHALHDYLQALEEVRFATV